MSFSKTEIALAEVARAISAFWKTHSCKLIPNWTRNRMITYTKHQRKFRFYPLHQKKHHNPNTNTANPHVGPLPLIIQLAQNIPRGVHVPSLLRRMVEWYQNAREIVPVLLKTKALLSSWSFASLAVTQTKISGGGVQDRVCLGGVFTCSYPLSTTGSQFDHVTDQLLWPATSQKISLK